MSWEKLGVLFAPDGSDATMHSHAAIPFAEVLNDDTIRVYFSSRNNQGKSLPFYLDCCRSNPMSIIRVAAEPLFDLGPLGTFDDSGIMPSWILTVGDKKFLYYIGWNPQVSVSYRLAIGLAVSQNCSKFQKYSLAPVCDRSLEEPYFNTAPCVLFDNDVFKMWYISCTGWEHVNGYPEPRYHVKYAESCDGVHWNKTGLVCIDYFVGGEAIGRPCVWKENGSYHMYFSYRMIAGYRNDKESAYRLGYASSADGKKWEIQIAEILPRDKQYDDVMIEYCHTLIDGDNKWLFYNGNQFGGSGICIAKWHP